MKRHISLRLLSAALLLSSVVASADTVHTVRRGQSLWKISLEHYGKGSLWPRIYAGNRDRIRNPNRIRPGQKLRIPGRKGYVEAWAIVTAYDWRSCCCGKFANGKTSTGAAAKNANGCAVNPKRIRYGSMVEIPGAGMRRADDTGPAMKRGRGLRIDVRFKSHARAKRWGRKKLRVKIWRKR